MKGLCRLAVFLFLGSGLAPAGETVRREIFTNFAPVPLLKETVRDTLSPEGRFVILPDKGAVLVIDQPERVAAAEQAIRSLDLPAPRLELQVGVRTGGSVTRPPAPARDPFSGGLDFPVPMAFAPPRVLIQPNGNYVVIPATPTRFGRRAVGTTLETQALAHTNGSVQLNLRFEQVDFAGFVRYGSPVLPLGAASVLPLQERIPRPLVMGEYLRHAVPGLPVFETTRISTSILVSPARDADTVHLEVLPRVTIAAEHGSPEQTHAFRQYRTKLAVKNGGIATLRAFRDAPDAFNEVFFGDEKHPVGVAELVLKARIVPGASERASPR